MTANAKKWSTMNWPEELQNVNHTMSSRWTIRMFEKSDLKEVMKINQECLPENYPDSFFLGLFQHAPKAFLVAVNEDAVIGYIMCRIERGISNYGLMPVKKGHIVSIAVWPRFRRIGVGTELIKRGIEGMKSYGVVEVFLEVRKTNTEAIGVYEKNGFQIKRVLRGYYRDGEDAYLMTKQV